MGSGKWAVSSGHSPPPRRGAHFNRGAVVKPSLRPVLDAIVATPWAPARQKVISFGSNQPGHSPGFPVIGLNCSASRLVRH